MFSRKSRKKTKKINCEYLQRVDRHYLVGWHLLVPAAWMPWNISVSRNWYYSLTVLKEFDRCSFCKEPLDLGFSPAWLCVLKWPKSCIYELRDLTVWGHLRHQSPSLQALSCATVSRGDAPAQALKKLSSTWRPVLYWCSCICPQ